MTSVTPWYKDPLWPYSTSNRSKYTLSDVDPWVKRSTSYFDEFRTIDRQFNELISKFDSQINLNEVNYNPITDSYDLSLDVTGYKPYELTVSVEPWDRKLTLQGKHEEKSIDGSKHISRQFKQSMTLPAGIDVNRIGSKLNWDGRTLKITAPVKTYTSKFITPGVVRDIPITRSIEY